MTEYRVVAIRPATEEELAAHHARKKWARWIQEATEAALAKKNSALPLNRRVKSNGNLYVRGTLVRMGHLRVEMT